jgi:hypothetical protein
MTSPQSVLDAALAGEFGELRGNISREFATALTAMVRREKPALCIEIGMAFGISTLAILEGLSEGGRLISIDPFQNSDFDGFGLDLVARTDRAAQHELIEAPDYFALPRLLKDGRRPNFAYIDGMHTFDYVLLDGFYVDKLLPVGGIAAFNDCGFRSIHKYLRFFRRHRRYEELDAGLAADYRGGNPLITTWRTLERRSNQDRYFRKLSDEEPAHNFFRNF